jgi:hypothetical protein
VGVELSDLLAGTTSVHQVDEVDVDLLQRLSRWLVDCYTTAWLTDAYLLALGDGAQGLKAKLNTEMLETLELVGDAESSEVAFELLIVAGSSLTGSLLLVPFLAFGKAVELVADAATRVVVEPREAVEVGCEHERHGC